jgi:hypothetical protein
LISQQSWISSNAGVVHSIDTILTRDFNVVRRAWEPSLQGKPRFDSKTSNLRTESTILEAATMKQLLYLALPIVLLLTLGASAQSDTTPSASSTNQATSPSSSSSTQSNSQDSTARQANPATSSTMSQSGTSTTSQSSLEGCIIRRETDYFLQPDTGQPVKLNSSQDLSEHVGHHVRVQGNVKNGSNSASSASNSNVVGNNSSSGGAYGSSSSGAGTNGSTGKVENGSSAPSGGTQYEAIDVSRVDTISETCPAGMQNQSAPTNNTTQSPK